MYGSDYDDDECGAAPGVMGHRACTNRNCSCHADSKHALSAAADKWPAKQEAPKFNYEPRSFVYQAEEPDVTVNYSFMKRVTEKALLLAIHDGNGLYEKWVPKSVVTGISETQIKIKSWFYKRNW